MKSFGKKAWMPPHPVLILGTQNEDGTPNAMNAAWAGQWDSDEIMISIGKHKTTENLRKGGDFTIAFATLETMVAADFVGIVSQKNDSGKILKSGLTSIASENVDAPIFTDFPMTLECRIKERQKESETGFYIIAEIVNILCAGKYLADNGRPDVEKMNLITFNPINLEYFLLGRCVGKAYSVGKELKQISCNL